MTDRLSGFRILILEAREEAQFARLLAEQGAEVLQCPMFTIRDVPDPSPSRTGSDAAFGPRMMIWC
jgi:uroporphyrinogen-III synthase